MKANRWVYLIALMILALAGGIFLWQRRQRHPERITLSDLPPLQPQPAQRLSELVHRNGRASPTAVSSGLRQ
ncbi:MAG: hypothetical protein RML36_06520 [Anaerolineae bacterium]|nr:hypothetical protein [Anaerolineae bacterium]MDW8099122.1 hypothetical protein [Anaerolineae bacterium]